VGIAGAQGSGKSTLAQSLALLLDSRGLKTTVLSLDDLYLPRAERERLSMAVHPLLLTRGVPGTHDVELGLQVCDAFAQGRAIRVPRFDKARDDRRPSKEWAAISPPVDVVLFEGWCVGARPQSWSALIDPVNQLECEEDPHGIWRRFVNDALGGGYQTLFARVHVSVLLAAPSFDVVYRWRCEQEHKLKARVGGAASRTMTDEEVARFIAHYERLTRHILDEMPSRADIVVMLDEQRQVDSMLIR
jgi:D-glycerate 3-kinase